MIGFPAHPQALRLPTLPQLAPLPSLVSALSRRAAIFGAVVVGTVPAAAMAANAGETRISTDTNAGFSGIAPADLDAGLLALGREWQASAERCDEADRALSAAVERTPEIPPPEALFLRATDPYALRCLAPVTYCGTGRRWFSPGAVKQLREAPEPTRRLERREPAPWGGDDEVVRITRFPDGEAVARRAEIVAADDAWRAAVAAAEAASGYTEAEAEAEAAHDDNRSLRRRIMTTPAETLAGVLVKARVSGWCWHGSAEMREQTADDAERGSTAGEDMAFSAVSDLVAMIERGAA